MKSLSRILLFFALLLFVFGAGCLAFFFHWMHTPKAIPESYRVFSIEAGDTLYGVSEKLRSADIIGFPKLWVNFARINNHGTIKAGEYMLAEMESPASLLALFNSGRVIQHTIMFVEGSRFADMLNVLEAHPKLKKKSDGQTYQDILKSIAFEQAHPEGWFFPDTYAFSAEDTVASVLARAHVKMKKVLDEEWQARAPNLPYMSPYEALIMASIVEKETGAPHERAQIAGVFVRRLEKGMRLQTDPTVIYGMGEKYDGDIRRKDLKEKTPYNTYVIDGLPPTPIALPGRAAIHAALNPEHGVALFFVAKGDGTHHFSATFEEHSAAVKKFQKVRRENYRSNYQLPSNN